jgi:2-dehydro-3-deoxyphosphogalactonate aldolase
MKITAVKPFTVKNPHPSRGGMYWFLVKLETDAGIDGWGEVYWHTYEPKAFASIVEDVFQALLLDQNPFRIESHFARFFNTHCKQHADLSKIGIFSGMEIACWDIIGKSLGKPIYELLGGMYRDKLRTYSYLYPEDPDEWHEPMWYNPEASAARAVEYVRMGFTAVKLDPVAYEHSVAPWQPSLGNLENAEKVIAEIRKAVGTKCDIIIGTHGQFTPSAAIRFAKRLEQYDPLWFEEPVPPENPDVLERICAATSIPIATGERLATKYEYVPLLNAGVDIIQVDVSGVGGLLEAKKIAAMAEAYHAQITPHSFAGPISFAAQVQLSACLPNFLIQEMVGTMGGFFAKLVPDCLNWQNGYVIPPCGPGLGIHVNEDEVRRNSVDRFTETDPLMQNAATR